MVVTTRTAATAFLHGQRSTRAGFNGSGRALASLLKTRGTEGQRRACSRLGLKKKKETSVSHLFPASFYVSRRFGEEGSRETVQGAGMAEPRQSFLQRKGPGRSRGAESERRQKQFG